MTLLVIYQSYILSHYYDTLGVGGILLLQGHNGRVTCCDASAAADFIVSGGVDYTVRRLSFLGSTAALWLTVHNYYLLLGPTCMYIYVSIHICMQLDALLFLWLVGTLRDSSTACLRSWGPRGAFKCRSWNSKARPFIPPTSQNKAQIRLNYLGLVLGWEWCRGGYLRIP